MTIGPQYDGKPLQPGWATPQNQPKRGMPWAVFWLIMAAWTALVVAVHLGKLVPTQCP